MKQAI